MNDTLQKLGDQGLCLIPVRFRSKEPIIANWQNRTWKDNDLGALEGQINVGVVLGAASGGIADIDLDNDDARAVAAYFLPSTEWIFGRKNAPRSHWIYRIKGDCGSSKRLVSPKLGTLCEYRATGAQTVFPPSEHESGELVEFSEFSSIGEASREELLEALGWIAAAAELRPVYTEGMRQDIALALAGGLLSAGKSKEVVARFVSALCKLTQDEEAEQRLQAVECTAQKLQYNQPVTQWRRLRELIGPDKVDAVAKHLCLSPGSQSLSYRADSRAASSHTTEEDKNDTGVAEIFSQSVNGRIMYVPELDAFYAYDNGLWREDPKSLLTGQRFDAFILDRTELVRKDPGAGPEACGRELKFWLKYRNRKNVENALKQARAYLRVPLAKLDQNDDALALTNGLLQLETGDLVPLRPAHYVTQASSTSYDPKATCPKFERFLAETFREDESLIAYVQAILGYCLTGRTDRQELYIFYGEGANGKSTLLNVVQHVLGPYCGSMMAETLFEGRASQINGYDLASLGGKRLAIAQEAQSNSPLNSPLVKQITGGDAIKVRMLYRAPFEMVPKFKLVVVCNKRPNLDVYDQALKRRIKLIPFENIVPGGKRDHRLAEKLKAEAPGILNWMLKGVQAYYSGEIRTPPSVKAATESYFTDKDSIKGFLSADTIKEQGSKVAKKALYEAYQSYCEAEALDALSKREFGTIIKRLDYEDTNDGQARYWKGLRLGSSDDPEESLRAFKGRSAALSTLLDH